MRPWVTLALAIALAGCGRGTRVRDGATPRVETALKVDNQNFLDATVYLLRGGGRFRIGVAPGLSSTVMFLRPEYVATTNELQFLIDFIGSERSPVTESITVAPGDVVELTIPPN